MGHGFKVWEEVIGAFERQEAVYFLGMLWEVALRGQERSCGRASRARSLCAFLLNGFSLQLGVERGTSTRWRRGMKEGFFLKNSVFSLIERRHSCRLYTGEPLDAQERTALHEFLGGQRRGPLGSEIRIHLLAQTQEDPYCLRGLGTYGFIKGATAFMAGAVRSSPYDLEDYGYVMEHAVFVATDLGLGTCWLGGTFTKSKFARRIHLAPDEAMPAIVAVGYEAPRDRKGLTKSHGPKGRNRLPMEKLFFWESFGKPLVGCPSPYAKILEAVRWAPSASNKQPWRVVVTEEGFHLYLQRTKGYGKDSLIFKLLGLADLQRVDMGIAMCHLELSAKELGFRGRWVREESRGPSIPGERAEYVISWKLEVP